MLIEIWSDVACPWCYVGTRRLDAAVEETGVAVDVVYRSFELDPRVPTGGESPPLVDYLVHKYGDRARVQAAHARLTDAGSELGIDFRWAGMRRANTFDCHRLLTWALETAGAAEQRALKHRMLHAYFTEGLDVADHAVLVDLCAAAGLDRDDAAAVLASDRYADAVRDAREAAHRDGIGAVPTFIIDGDLMLQGAHGTDVWVKVLTRQAAGGAGAS